MGIRAQGIFLSILLGLLLSWSFSQAAALKIMPLGDSLTEGGYNLKGVYYSQGGGYRLPLELQVLPLNPEVTFVGSLLNGPADMPQRSHEGHSGWRIEQISQGVVGWLQTYQPNIILLMIGTNNMWKAQYRPNAPKLFANLLDQIWTTLPYAEVMASSLINTSTPETNFYIHEYNGAIKKIIKSRIAEGRPAVWVDMNRLSGITPKDLTDGAHPTAVGYAKMARVWFQFLEPQLAIHSGVSR